MKLLLKQKVFSWFDSYNIFDENENIVYKVKGEFAWGHLLRIYDENDNELGFIKQKMFTWFPKFFLNVGSKEYVLLKKFALAKEVFNIEDLGIEVTGNFWRWNYEIKRHGEVIARVSRKLSFTDVYELDIKNKDDALLILEIVLSIDALHCDSGGNNE
ncbi:MAG: LURP-one-related family protein [bacterium]|nr:LURP-one-related family protein [bacterium]